MYVASFINITLLLSKTHSRKYYLLFWKIVYFDHGLLKNRSSIHNLWQISVLLFSHIWILLVYVYNFKYMFLTQLQPNYLGIYFLIWYKKIFTYRVIQAKNCLNHSSFILFACSFLKIIVFKCHYIYDLSNKKN